jgi:hypothetical protein
LGHQNQQVSLLDLLDRLLDKGVVVDGEILLTVADIDLVYLGLKCILSSVETLKKGSSNNPLREIRNQDGGEDDDVKSNPTFVVANAANVGAPFMAPEGRDATDQKGAINHAPILGISLPRNDQAPRRSSEKENLFFEGDQEKETTSKAHSRGKIKIDSEKVEKGLVKLVLTVVELLRKLMERQAIRRMEGGSLGQKKIEELGQAFLRLDEKMKENKEYFGLKDEDVNHNLGPLGNLI